MSDARPLILTLQLDADAFARFDGERRAWFPPALNFIPAHVTLFHHLPGEARDAIVADLTEVARRRVPFEVEVAGLRKLGRGTAYELRSSALSDVRADLSRRWAAWLTPQDRQGFRPHVTVQNKVAAEEAHALYERLSAEFRPFTIRGEGLLLWRYLGGPWAEEGVFGFSDAQ